MKTVFLIEDDKDTRDMLIALLEMNDFSCVGYDNFSEALDHIVETKPCAIFYDLHVPGKITAEAFLQRVHASHPKLTMIVTSGDPSAAAAAREQGADGVIVKPFDPQEVVRLASLHCSQS